MIKLWSYLLLTFLSIGISKTFAQKPTIKLIQAYQKALEGYPGIEIKEAEIKAATLNQKRVDNNRLPQAKLQLQSSYGTLESSTGAFFPLPGTFNVSGNKAIDQSATTANTYGSVVADWEIFSFGKLNKESEAASFKTKEAQSNLLAYQLYLKSTVSKLFINVLYDDIKLIWAQKNALRVKEILEISKGLANAGLKPGADTALASSSYLQIQSDKDFWKGKYEASKYHLAEFTLQDVHEINMTASNFFNVESLTQKSAANENHPYLNRINNQIAFQNTSKEAIKRSAFPSLSLLGGVSTRGSGAGNEIISNRFNNGFNNGATNYLIGLGITWNLTGIHDKNLEQKKIEQNKIIAQSNYKQQELQLNTGINATKAQVSEQINQVLKTKEAVEKAQEAYSLYKTRYENGLINLTDLLQIQLLLQQSENKQIEAIKNFWEQVIIQSELTADFTNLFEIF